MFTNVFRNSQLNNMRVTRGKNKCLKKKTFDQLKVQPLFLPINIENMSFGVKLELERACICRALSLNGLFSSSMSQA